MQMDIIVSKAVAEAPKYKYRDDLAESYPDIDREIPAEHRRTVNRSGYTQLTRALSQMTVSRWRLTMASRRLWVRFQYVLKRLLDLTVIVASLPAVLPIAIGTAIAVRLDSPGPIVFRQTRVGRGGHHFTCLKFRSMYTDAEERKQALLAENEADGPIFKMQDDPRITRVGRFIRRTSIDELPQLLNVLKGEMSLVGPRPPLPQEVRQYTVKQLGRLDATPGLTGLQQVSGRSDLDFERWVQLDLEYIDQQSFWSDVKIMLKTIPVVLLGRGAY